MTCEFELHAGLPCERSTSGRLSIIANFSFVPNTECVRTKLIPYRSTLYEMSRIYEFKMYDDLCNIIRSYFHESYCPQESFPPKK